MIPVIIGANETISQLLKKIPGQHNIKWLQKTPIMDGYSETNVMQFLLNFLRVNGLYMFRALLAHHQEALHKRHLAYCVRVI
jgi:hypothetical protein